MRKYILLFSSLLLLTSCKTAQPVVSNQQSVISNQHSTHRDSVVICDSIFVRMQGDTVWLEKWHTEYKDKVVERTDTLYRDREVTTQLPPERYVPAFYKWCTGLALALLIAFGAYIALRVYLRRL